LHDIGSPACNHRLICRRLLYARRADLRVHKDLQYGRRTWPDAFTLGRALD